MKETFKNILKRLNVYYPLQSFYRRLLFSFQQKKNRRQYRRYAGSGFTCNVCGARYEKFVPSYPSSKNKNALLSNHVIAGYGENVFCPACMSTSRERLIIAYIREEINIIGKTILHLSPEKNIYHFLSPSATVTTADIFPGFYRSTDPNVQYQDATRFSFKDNNFDIVIGNHILEHIPDDKKAMKEIFRVLKPGGIAVLQVPYSETIVETIEDPLINDPALQSALYGQKDHVRIYLLSDYIQRLGEAGFMVNIAGEKALVEFTKFAIQPGEKFLNITKPVRV